MIKCHLVIIAALAITFAPAIADANATLINVTPVDAGCVSGPTGPTVQLWDVQPGMTYTITISNVTECANGGTDATPSASGWPLLRPSSSRV